MGLFRDASAVFVANVTIGILSLASVGVFIAIYGATSYGQFALFQAIVVILKIVGDAGINNAVEKRVSERRSENIVASALTAKLLLIASVSATIYILHPRINTYLGTDLSLYLIPALFIREISYLMMSVLRGELKVASSIWLTALHRGVFLLVGVGLAYIAPAKPQFLALSYIAGWIPVMIVAAKLVETTFGSPTIPAIISIYRFSKYDFISSIVGSATYDWLDVLMIGIFLTPAHVSAYEAAWRLAGGVLLISQAIGFILFPNISKWDKEGSLSKFETVFPRLLTGAVLVIPPAIVGALVLGPTLLGTLFGPETQIASTALIILLIGKLPESVNNLVGRALLGLDLPRLTAASSIVFILANIILNAVLIERYELAGAAAATAIAISVNTGMNTIFLSLNVRLSVLWTQIIQILLATIVMSIFLTYINSKAVNDSLIGVLGVVLVSAAIYFAVLYLSPTFRKLIQS